MNFWWLNLPFNVCEGHPMLKSFLLVFYWLFFLFSSGYSPVYLAMKCCCLQVSVLSMTIFLLYRGSCVCERGMCNLSLNEKESGSRTWGNEILPSWRIVHLGNAASRAFPTLGQISAGLSLDKGWPWLRRLQSSQTELLRRKHTSSHRKMYQTWAHFFNFFFFIIIL